MNGCKLLAGLGMLWAVTGLAAVRYGDRMVPIDPILDEVNLARPEMQFFWNGDDPMSGAEVSVQIDAAPEPLRATLGEDRKVRFDLGKLTEGEHQLTVAFAGGSWKYAITVRPPEPENGKKLNNFVRELVNRPLADGEFKFTLARDHWVFIGFDRPYRDAQAFLDGATEPVVTYRADEPSETLRYLRAGEHAVRIVGATSGRLRIHQIKDLKCTAKTFYLRETKLCSGNTYRDYGFEFMRRWIFPAYGWVSVGRGWKTSPGVERFDFGNRETAIRGKRLTAHTGNGGSDRADRANPRKMRSYMCGAPAYATEGLSLEYDEHKVNAPRAEMDAFAEECWEMVAKRDDRPLIADYMDMPSNFLTNLIGQISSISAIVNSGRGHGAIVPEMYLGAQRTMPEIIRQDGVALRYTESMRKAMPSAPAHILHLMSGWLTVGEWSNWCSSECDLRVVVDRYLRQLATEPIYADVGGVGMSTLACSEEMARFVAAAVHHYCIEGRTDSLAERLGFELFPQYVLNGDFMEELGHWQAAPAPGGSIVHERKENYGGKRGQSRMMRYNTQCGEHFAVFTRSGQAPNVLSQPVKGLKVGDYYSLMYAFADYDEAMNPKSVKPDHAFGAEVTNAEIVDALSFDTVTQRKHPLCGHTVLRRVVFKALAPEAELRFSDWKSASEMGGEAGRKHLVNFISIHRYLVKDEAELSALKSLSGIGVCNGDERQVVIYGATPAGIAAAVALRRAGKEPILLEPSAKVGGLTTGGLGQTDIGNKAAFGGLARKFYQDIKAHYEKDGAWKFQKRTEYRPKGQSVWASGEDSMWTFEPSAAASVLDFWLRDWRIKTHLNARLDRGPGGVTKVGNRIAAIRLEDGRVFRAQQFIDATYEGDLLAAAGVSYTVGREANSVYGETISGVERALMRNHQLKSGVDPYVVKGDPKSGLLPGVELDTDEPDGAGDRRVQAYCYRMCLTDDPRNRIPFKKPAGYRELDYELLLRNFEAGETGVPWINSPMPNRKTDTNNRTGFSTDFIGGNWNYPEASYAERERIAAAHLKYQQGLMWTLANHPRVPEEIRREVSRWGTCKDEFPGERGDGWQWQLYVREARRMIGEYVMTEHECRGERKVPRPVAMGAYGMDSHNVRRYVGKDGFAHNEGNIEDYSANRPGQPYCRFAPYSIDYGALVPKRAECSNLLVPVCISASHMAFGSIRMEPAFFAMGEVAGIAAAMAIDAKCAVQTVDYAALRESLLAHRVVVESAVKLPKLNPMPEKVSVGLVSRKLAEPVIPDSRINFAKNAEFPAGACRLVADATDVYIFSSDDSGADRARAMLRQLVTEDGQGGWQLPCVEILDGFQR